MSSPSGLPPSIRHVRSRPRGFTRALAVTIIGFVAFMSAGTATAWYELQQNIDRPTITQYLPTQRPTGAQPPSDELGGRAVNILVMGSDSRDGDNGGSGSTVEGMRSDTTLLVHIAADRSRADVISIPRDLIVDVPACALADGSQASPQYGVRFNSAFSIGATGGDLGAAAACTISTFERMTNIYIDDFAIVDFSGFQTMVDAIGGVELCLDQPVEDPKADLSLTSGCQILTGAQALGLARARASLGDGSDIGRIARQQELLAAMVNTVTSSGVIANPTALLPFLGAATEALTTSERLGTLTTMAGLAYSLRNLDSTDITFATVPFDPSGNVVLTNQDGAALWESLAANQAIVLPPPGAQIDDGLSITTPGQSASESPEAGTTDPTKQ